jgi:hypothetical protein
MVLRARRDRGLSAATNRVAVVVDGWRDPAEALAGYERWLVGLPLSERTRREYARWVRLFCGWLRDGIDERAVGVDPLADPRARDYAARDFKRFLKWQRLRSSAGLACLGFVVDLIVGEVRCPDVVPGAG